VAGIRACERCGQLFRANTRGRPRKYCERCGSRYGYAHQLRRKNGLAAAYGQPCRRCGRVMLQGQELHLDHDDRDPSGQTYRGFRMRGAMRWRVRCWEIGPGPRCTGRLGG
jgi:hypothetical protein